MAMAVLGRSWGWMLVLFATGVAQAHQGVLDSQGWCGFDWLRPGGDLLVSRSALHQGVTLTASFRWMGQGAVEGVEGKTGEHAILGLVQGVFAASASQFCPASGREEHVLNSPRHGTERQALHRRGIGILLAPVGLVIEVWNGDGTASTWSARHAGCALRVPAGTVSTPCVPLAQPGTDGDAFLTLPPQDFTIAGGRTYWLTLSYRQQTSTRGLIEAKLQADAPDGRVLQQARMAVESPAWRPDEPVETVVGRTGPEFPEQRARPVDIAFSVSRVTRTPPTP